jgi:oligoribonuclease NrnB/cAMP/cGMP phosphodiesterase (DHH superfamily)
MKCFYHSDADGVCSGFWVWSSYVVNNTEDYIKSDYGKPFPFDIIKPGEEVWLVDYSIEPSDMRILLGLTSNVTWIDHHKTAIDKYHGFEFDIPGLRVDGIAGCMLTYCYTKHMEQPDGSVVPFNEELMTKEAPLFTKLIADYDVWKFKYGEDTKLFQIAFTAHNLEPWSSEWNKFFGEEESSGYECTLIAAGKEMMQYRDGWAKSVMEIGFESEFEGHSCYAVNLPRCNSQYFDSLEKEYDMLTPFYWNGEQWIVSLYSTKIDVSEIAVKYGGGGHKGAAGFQCAELPFKKR